MTLEDVSSRPADPGAAIPVLEINMHDDARLLSDPWAFWDGMRRESGMVKLEPGSDDGDDVYMAIGYEQARDTYRRTDLFSNEWMYLYKAKPETYVSMLGVEDMNPPEHTPVRYALNPLFTLREMRLQQDRIREIVRNLIAGFKDAGRCDVLTDFTQMLPATLILEMLGVPSADSQMMVQRSYALVHPPMDDPDGSKFMENVKVLDDYIFGMIADRRANPTSDLTSAIVQALDSQTDSTDAEIKGHLLLLIAAGLDTVANSLAAFLVHLSRDDQLRRQVVSHPDTIPQVIEELLRMYSIVTSVKVVKEDVEFHGCPLRKGDRVGAHTLSANRDESVFERGTECQWDRPGNKHIAFGAGAHRCIGSHLARLELIIALEEWHREIPEYRVDESREIVMHCGHMTGFQNVPMTWV